MTEEEMEEIIRFCEKHHLALIALETLQNSIYPNVKNGNVQPTHSPQSTQAAEYASLTDSEGNLIKSQVEKNKFRSFRYMVQKLNSKLELFSIHSISKGPFYK